LLLWLLWNRCYRLGQKYPLLYQYNMFLKPCTSSRKKKKKINKNAKKKTEFTGTYSNKVWDAILKCGITIEELYPYKGVITKGISLDKLKFHKLCNIQRYGLVRLDKYDDTALMRSVAKQPTVVSVNACQWPQKVGNAY